MLSFIGKRVASLAAILVALAATIFVLQQISPLDPVRAQLGAQASAQAVAQRRAELGLDRPATAQFWSYLTGLVRGDLGDSYRTRQSVSSDLVTYIPATLELTLTALAIALVLALVFAVSTVLRWPGARVVRGLLLTGAVTPTFLLGILGILVLYQQLGMFPAGGRSSLMDAPSGPTHLLVLDSVLAGRWDAAYDAAMHLALPALAIALAPAVAIGRVLAAALEQESRSDYARTARAKGLTERTVVRRHILRNSVGPALSMTGLQVGLMFAGVLVVEQVFGWPGVGQYVALSIPVADFPAIGGVTLVLGVAYVVINAFVDVAQAVADPRVQA